MYLVWKIIFHACVHMFNDVFSKTPSPFIGGYKLRAKMFSSTLYHKIFSSKKKKLCTCLTLLMINTNKQLNICAQAWKCLWDLFLTTKLHWESSEYDYYMCNTALEEICPTVLDHFIYIVCLIKIGLLIHSKFTVSTIMN